MTAAIARKGNQPPVYLDYQATTPCDPRVLQAMLPWFTEKFGNPASITHAYGREAEAAVERARGQLAALVHADPREIVFTSGATEANNLAVKGALRFHKQFGKDHIVTLVTEHKCVLESATAMEQEGFRATYLPVEPSGLVDLDRLKGAIEDKTALVSVMAAHNEIGVIQPLADIGALCRARGVLFHTDAAQAVGKIPVDVDAMQIDLMSISGHKVYGPKGVGALYIRRRPRARIVPLIDGGGQERGMRSGTLPTPLCIGLGEAAALAQAEMTGEGQLVVGLSQPQLPRRPGAGADGGLPGPRAFDRLRLHGRRNRAVVCLAGHGPLRRAGGCLAAHRNWPVHDRGGGRFCGRHPGGRGPGAGPDRGGSRGDDNPAGDNHIRMV
jgi:cysteine desulfurase